MIHSHNIISCTHILYSTTYQCSEIMCLYIVQYLPTVLPAGGEGRVEEVHERPCGVQREAGGSRGRGGVSRERTGGEEEGGDQEEEESGHTAD